MLPYVFLLWDLKMLDASLNFPVFTMLNTLHPRDLKIFYKDAEGQLPSYVERKAGSWNQISLRDG